MKKTIAVDFDGTLCCSLYPLADAQNWLNKLVLWYIKREQQKGTCIILWTCRTDDVDSTLDGDEIYPNSLRDALKYLKALNFIPDLVNESPIERVELYGGSSRKVGADKYIDDKNVGLLGWLFRATHKYSINKFKKMIHKLKRTMLREIA